MSLISLPFTFSVGAVIVAAQHNSNFQTIYNDYNGNITDANIASGASIGYAKLSLNNSILATDIKSTEVLDIGNLPTGTTANKLVELDGSAKLPAIDGSALTNVVGSVASLSDYGTASSSPTVITNGIKFAMGNISVANKSSTAITGLPFSSSTSYKVTCNQVAGTLSLMNGPAAISYTSGSQCNIQNASDTTFTISWIAIGT